MLDLTHCHRLILSSAVFNAVRPNAAASQSTVHWNAVKATITIKQIASSVIWPILQRLFVP